MNLGTSGSKGFFITGSEIAYDLNRNYWSSGDKAFLNNYLKALYTADNSGVYTITTTTSTTSPFSGLSSFTYSTNTASMYNVAYPDVIAPNTGAVLQLTYSGGQGACISYNGGYRLFYCGFPFETIDSSTSRNSLMSDALNFFGISPQR